MSIKNNRRAIITPLVIALAIIVGIFLGRYYKNTQVEKRFYIYPRTDKLSNIINFIHDEYVDPISKETLVENTIPKILDQLDPHSIYIPASELESVNEPLEGNFSGIGVQFNMLNDTLVVIQTVANGPSEKVGILAGDRIVRVDTITVAGVKMPSDSIVKLLRGPKGTKVSVGVERKDVKEILNFDIVRDNIPLYSVDASYMINDSIGYIKINKFARTTFDEFISAVKKLEDQHMKKLILDLRGNGGGYMNASVNIADQFLADKELIVYTKGHAKGREDFRSSPGGICAHTGLEILIDEGSASASEILTGAIQDNDRGLIIGRRSFGKGLVQEQQTLSDGSAIRLTIARYYTPTGRCIQKPYNHGRKEYYNDLSERFMNGEMEDKDSIHFNDSLKFTTPKGHIVYGGGGIMPDVFVPMDTTGVTDYYVAIRNKGLIYRYSLIYADNHRDALEKLTDYKQIDQYLYKNHVFDSFIKYAAKQGVPRNTKELKVSGDIIQTQLHAYISRNILDNAGFYPIIQRIDKTLQVAIKKFEEGKKD